MEENKKLGYDVYEDDRDFEQDGLTGNVKKYAIEKLKFPCFILSPTEEIKIPMYRINVLNSMSGVSNDLEEDDTISIYYSDSGKTIYICKIISKQVKSFLKLFEEEVVTGYLDKGTELRGDYLYVLSS